MALRVFVAVSVLVIVATARKSTDLLLGSLRSLVISTNINKHVACEIHVCPTDFFYLSAFFSYSSKPTIEYE